MRNFKKFLTLVLAVMMVVSAMSFTTSAAVTAFKDVDAENESLVKAVDLLEYMGITKGVSETEFGAEQAVTREQFALFMYRLMKGGKNAPATASNTTKFVDLQDQTYFYAISWANAQGIINGTSDTTFHPKNGITLQDAYTMVVRALDYEEEEDLIYPHGYIDVAEQEGVALDAGLDSELGYEDTLTRGDMAIILYNAFFAETAIPTVDEKVVKDGNEWYIKEVTTYDRLCEKHFGVKEVKYQAVATPLYANSEQEATYDLGYDAAFFELVYDDDTTTDEVPEYCYLEPAQIGLEAEELDDYFLGEFTMFVTTEKEDGNYEIKKVLFSDCNMVKKTVSDLALGTVSSNKAKSYYPVLDENGDVVLDENDEIERNDAKLLSGKITSGSDVMYVFNAPYTYIKPNYAAKASDALKYHDRNANNLKAIDFEMIPDGDVDYFVADTMDIVSDPIDLVDVYYEETATTVKAYKFWNNDDEDYVDDRNSDEYFTKQATELLTGMTNDAGETTFVGFEQVYTNGLYEADLYDVDGDGIYEYIDYKPYTFFQVDSDEDYDFSDSDHDAAIPYVYTNEATVVGAEFVDEDYVIGYVDELTQTVKIAEVIKPTVSSISKIKNNSGSVVLADGTPVNVGSKWKLVSNFVPAVAVDEEMTDFEAYEGLAYEDIQKDLVLSTAKASGLLDADNLDEEEIEFYIYKDVVLHTEGIDDNLKFTENLIIPLDIDGNVPEKEFNKETGDRIWYIYAWVDGDCKYVPVETEDVLPEVVDNTGDEPVVTKEYNLQLCTYSIDADGIYTIKSLGFDIDDDDDDDDDEYLGVSQDLEVLEGDEDEQYMPIVDAETPSIESEKYGEREFYAAYTDVMMVKKAGTRFSLMNAKKNEVGEWEATDKKAFDADLVLKSYTKILVLTYDDKKDKHVMVEYDATSFKASADTAFSSVTFLLSNNPDSKSKEDLVLLFATVEEDFDLEVKKDKNGQRIVSLSTPGVDENGYYRNYYELFNPLTGAKELDVAGNFAGKTPSSVEEEELATGTIVELKGGMVDEKGYVSNKADEDYLGVLDTSDASSLVWITEYDAADDFIAVVPATVGADACCKDAFADEIEKSEEVKFYDVTKNTAVTVLKYSDAGENTTKWGSMTLGDISTIADAKKEFKCYSDKMTDTKGNLVTKYAEYLKAYISYTEADDEDENDVADYIIIVVNKLDDSDILLSAKEAEHDSDCANYDAE